MRLLSAQRVFQVAIVAAAVSVLGANDAQARSWGKHGSYGSYGSHGSYGSYASYGSYGSSASYATYSSYGSSASAGSYGSSASAGSAGSSGGGLFARWHARKAARKAARASSGSSASYGSHASYGSSGSYASSGSYGSAGSAGSYASYGGVVDYGMPVEYGTPVEYGDPVEQGTYDSETPTPPTAPDAADADSADLQTNATIHVTLPADAMVFVNGAKTSSTGEDRRYVSRGLRRGLSYAYKIRVEYESDGEPKVENRLVRLTAGDSVDLAFGDGVGQLAEATPATTELKLQVPEQAKVFLAGSETQQTGQLRTYSTTQLSSGQTWDDYVVRVELEKDGKKLVEQRSLTLEGGQSYSLSIDFADERVALLD